VATLLSKYVPTITLKNLNNITNELLIHNLESQMSEINDRNFIDLLFQH
jgi:hypothetical protein